MTNRILKLLISLIYLAWYRVCHAIPYRTGKQRLSTLVVLTYHSIEPHQLKRFLKQLKMIKRYHAVFPDADVSLNTGHRYVAVTFDDGFQSVVDNVLPALARLRIPVMLFIPTGYLGRKPLWKTHGKNSINNTHVITAKQLKTLRHDLVHIGSHSVNHKGLTQLEPQEIMKELLDSKKALEAIVGREIACFSLPYGAYDATVLELARKAGYKHVFSSWPKSQIEPDNFLTGRINTGADDWALEFRLKLEGAYQWLPIGITLKQRLRNLFTINFSDKFPFLDKA